MHCLAAPIALIVFEGAINDRLIAAGPDPEGRSHFRMLIFYVLRNDYSASGVYAFLLNWFLFNIAAPTPFARYGSPTTFGGSFEPTLSSYLISPVSASALLLLAAMIGGSAVRSRSKAGSAASSAIVLALLAYALVRGMFFLIFNPAEPLLFSPAITLAYLLAIAMPFAVSNIPAKPILPRLTDCAAVCRQWRVHVRARVDSPIGSNVSGSCERDPHVAHDNLCDMGRTGPSSTAP